MGPADYLKMPYGRHVVPESDGTFRAEIIEFPGCIAVGDTAAEALANLEDVAASWLEATIARGQRIPDPVESGGFSGKLVVRLPKTLHKKAARIAAQEGVSLNQFIVSSIAEQVGHSQARSMFARFTRVWEFDFVLPAHFHVAAQSYPCVPCIPGQGLITSFAGSQVTENPTEQWERSHA